LDGEQVVKQHEMSSWMNSNAACSYMNRPTNAEEGVSTDDNTI